MVVGRFRKSCSSPPRRPLEEAAARQTPRRMPGAAAVTAAVLLGAGAAAAADWRVESFDGAPVLGVPEMRFDAGGGLSGSTGCNRFNARAAVEDGALVVPGPVAMTRMACPGDALAAQEAGIVAMLEGRLAMSFDPLADRLTLEKGGRVLVLAPAPPESGLPAMPATHAGRPAPEGMPPYLGVFGLAGDLDVRARPAPDAAPAGAVPSGTVLRNAGCEAHGGRDWCRVETLDGGVRGWAEATHLEPADAALRAGQGAFDAAGWLPCARGAGAPSWPCGFGVARDGGGTAVVVVSLPGGGKRALFFVDGAFAFADTSEAGGGFETSSRREADLNFIRVDDERYEVPDAVIHGG